MKKIYFLFGIHNHQPVGNFPHVFEKAYQVAYKPFIDVFNKHKKIKWSLHCTGILWDFFEEKHPEYIAEVSEMIKENRIEILTGGYYEPILPSIPDIDKFMQIKKLTNYIIEKFGYNPTGMWTAERVWEPQLAKIMNESQIRYTVLDDQHFLSAGLSEKDLIGYFLTEEQGKAVAIFPISLKLRYMIPFRPVEETIRYLSELADESGIRAIVMADDGEKFGLWPDTYKHVYEDKWLDEFLTSIENNEWIETITFSDFLQRFPPVGRVYLPTASYFEMSEWSLFTDSGLQFEDILEEVGKMGNSQNIKRFLRGGIWRNFLAKYPEANNIHKKMIYVSDRVHKEIKKLPNKHEVLDSLHAGQCNCAYWHGVFGGLYLPHLRNALYNKLINAENLLKKNEIKLQQFDFDCDGKQEIIIESPKINLYLAPHYGGSIIEWDLKSKLLNLQSVLTRRREIYHRKLENYLKNKNKIEPSKVQTIHELVKVKEDGLERYLNYDWYRKVSLLDHFLHPDTKPEDFYRVRYGEQGDFIPANYNHKYFKKPKKIELELERGGNVWISDRQFKVGVVKKVVLNNTERVEIFYTVKNNENISLDLWFATEFNLYLNPQKKFDEVKNIKEYQIYCNENKLNFSINLNNDMDLWLFPIETVSLSEAGFERTFQGVTVLIHKKIILPSLREFSFNIFVDTE